MNKFSNVVIFGASQGIGRALAIEYSNRGSKIAVLTRNESQIISLRNEITAKGRVCFDRRCDITSIEDVRAGIKFAQEKLGKLDLVIINSGVGGPNWMGDFSAAQFKDTFDVNTFGIANVLEAAIPLMLDQGYGTIAGVTSLADVRGYGGSSSYSASKAAASILLEAARVELKSKNIKIITVRPGFVKTAMTDKNEFKMPFLLQPNEAAKKIASGIAKGRSIVQFPFPIVWATRLIKFLPNWIYDWAMNKARPKTNR